MSNNFIPVESIKKLARFYVHLDIFLKRNSSYLFRIQQVYIDEVPLLRNCVDKAKHIIGGI